MEMKQLYLLAFLAAPLFAAAPAFDYRYDATRNIWTLANGAIAATFELSQSGNFRMTQAGLNASPWLPPAGIDCSPIQFTFRGNAFDASTQFILVEQHTELTNRNGMRQVITLADQGGQVQVAVHIDM